MSEIPSVIAFPKACGAVLLGNDTVCKVERRNEAFIKNQVDKPSQSIGEGTIEPQARSRSRAGA